MRVPHVALLSLRVAYEIARAASWPASLTRQL